MKLIKCEKSEPQSGLDRRSFLKNSGLAMGGAVLAGGLPMGLMQKAQAHSEGPAHHEESVLVRTVCTHCSVGCGIVAEVQDGVWIGQEPAFDHPFNLGSHCAKGAAVRDHGRGERRLKYPMKLVEGRWQKIDWDQAIDEIGNRMLEIRAQSGPDSVYWLGSANHGNEQAYLFRKFAALWGSNNTDHQGRNCNSSSVAGVSNTLGYGAATQSFNDLHNAKALFILGDPAETHPVAMQHIFRAKEKGAALIVVDPRFTRTAAHADLHISIRPGTDVAFIWGMVWHIFQNGWEDKSFIEQRVFGLDGIRKEAAKWTPKEVERVSGVAEAQVRLAAKIMAEHKPGSFLWGLGGTQNSNNNARAYCIFQLVLGNVGIEGGGVNGLSDHDNVQGVTDLGPNADSLPGYYGLNEAAWKHWAKVWDIDYDWLVSRFDQGQYEDGAGKLVKPMFSPGIPASRWMDGVLEKPENISQRNPIKAMVFAGHAPNSQTRGKEVRDALNKLDLLVVVDSYPTVAMHDRTDNTYLLPACTQFETSGSVTSSNRSLQWREPVMEPLFESLPDHAILYKFAQKFGFDKELLKNIKVENDIPVIEDILREINKGAWAIGYTGQSPERLKLHQENWHTFDTTSLQAVGGPCDGEYFGLPWPCWGKPEQKHPGSPILYDASKGIAQGGLTFGARFGAEYQGKSLLAERSFTQDSEIKAGYDEFTADSIKKLGWWNDLTEAEKTQAEGKNWKTDLSGGIQRVAIKHGCAPHGNAKARCNAWNLPDPIPVHREPLYTNRRDLTKDYPTYADMKRFWRLPTRYASIQEKDFSKEFPLIMTSGRLAEHAGSGDDTRSNPWLAELQPNMYVEINPRDANNAGVKQGEQVWVEGPEGGRIKVTAFVTQRVKPGLVFMPIHFAGKFQGEDLSHKYPEDAEPYVVGESCNTVFAYGYDSVTAMQESQVSLCRLKKA